MSVDDILFAPVAAADIKVPDAWIDVLGKIRSEQSWATATLAGGALRDTDNGRQIKDVDIFITYLSDNDHTGRLLSSCLPNVIVTAIEHNVHNTSMVGAAGINHFVFEQDGWKFEISQSTLPNFDYKVLLDSFDIGLCMIALDQNNKVYRAPEYKKDVANKTITIVRDTGGRELDHAERIQRKYNGWAIVK
jgi:hypothetical protein